jgi:DNA-binding response OmpR family regulator
MIFVNKIDPPTVLLVDADFEQSLASKSELEAQGYRVVWVDSGEEACTTFEREKIDAVVVAAFLPDMHVLDLVDEIAAKRNRNVPIIINEPCPGYRHDFRYWAADAIIEKSPATQKLFAQVAALL